MSPLQSLCHLGAFIFTLTFPRAIISTPHACIVRTPKSHNNGSWLSVVGLALTTYYLCRGRNLTRPSACVVTMSSSQGRLLISPSLLSSCCVDEIEKVIYPAPPGMSNWLLEALKVMHCHGSNRACGKPKTCSLPAKSVSNCYGHLSLVIWCMPGQQQQQCRRSPQIITPRSRVVWWYSDEPA